MLAYAYGSPNWMFGLSGISCYTPRLMMMSITQGDFAVVDASQWHEKRYDDPGYQIPETVTIWGRTCLPPVRTVFGHWYVDLMKRGTQLLVIDPRCTWIASRAKLWLQLRPGTDAALALGFIHVILKENLWDQALWKMDQCAVSGHGKDEAFAAAEAISGPGDQMRISWCMMQV